MILTVCVHMLSIERICQHTKLFEWPILGGSSLIRESVLVQCISVNDIDIQTLCRYTGAVLKITDTGDWMCIEAKFISKLNLRSSIQTLREDNQICVSFQFLIDFNRGDKFACSIFFIA